jgi:hypothetical protein
VIARNGREWGAPPAEWLALFARMAHELGRTARSGP